MRVLILGIIILFFGCVAETEGTDMTSKDAATRAYMARMKAMQWGQTKSFEPPWKRGESRAVVTLDMTPGETPISKTLLLAYNLLANPGSTEFLPRWVIQFGAGGGNAEFVVDATRLNQLSLPAQTVRVSFRLDEIHPTVKPFVSPTKVIVASAFLADMSTTTGAPTYTQFFTVASGSATESFAIPAGASAVQIAGIDGNELFDATSIYTLTVGSSTFQRFDGTALEPITNRLDRIPVPGGVDQFSITNNGANPIFGWLVWYLDF